jgi:hypothetical protein
VHDLGHHRQQTNRTRADAGRQQQIGKVGGTALGRRSEGAMEPTD